MSIFVPSVEKSVANGNRVMCLAVVCLIIANPGMSLYRAPKAKDSLQEDIELRSADADANTRAPSSVGEAKEGMA